MFSVIPRALSPFEYSEAYGSLAANICEDTMQASRASARSIEKLSFELVYHIVACLDDRPDDHYDEVEDQARIPLGLLACSLVCRSWNQICRAHVFRVVTLKHGQDVLTRRLSFLHSTAPHLYKNIRRLNVFLEGDHRTFAEWIPDCISRLTNVSALRLDAELIRGTVLDILSTSGIMSLLPTLRLKQLALDLWGVDGASLDLIPVLSACATTVESLSLEIYEVYEHGEASASAPPSPVRLDALRHLQIFSSICTLPSTTLIECPNLESLTLECFVGDGRWYIPSWIPATLSELILHVDLPAEIPDLSTSIRPSVLTIRTFRRAAASYSDAMAGVGAWIGRLPDPCAIQELTIIISSDHSGDGDGDGSGSCCYPEAADYAGLCTVLEPLYTRGALQHIHLNIARRADGAPANDGPLASATAVVAAERALAPILEEMSAGDYKRITCTRGKVDVLLIRNIVDVLMRKGFV
ncbi:hypothetical protein EYR40_002145 [Pleurotus pulmonarius]|nr:hypothetical protein EYR40_002145 [Pleurotus pulmonarius]KAF4607648.1 hypothetical protein EYR38_001721 [Pleurotus pulmonarius]